MKHILIILFICTFSIHLWMGETAKFPNKNDAKGLLDRSQGTKAFGRDYYGHARNHVAALTGYHKWANVRTITAFEDNYIQDDVMQRMIRSGKAKKAINALNNAALRYHEFPNEYYIPMDLKFFTVTFTIADLGFHTINNPPPKLGVYDKGELLGSFEMEGAKLVLAHKAGYERIIGAEVLVYTMFPVLFD